MLGNLYEVKAAHLPAWSGRFAGLGAPDLLPNGEWIIVVRVEVGYITFLCTLGVRTCYPNHIVECCENT